MKKGNVKRSERKITNNCLREMMPPCCREMMMKESPFTFCYNIHGGYNQLRSPFFFFYLRTICWEKNNFCVRDLLELGFFVLSDSSFSFWPSAVERKDVHKNILVSNLLHVSTSQSLVAYFVPADEGSYIYIYVRILFLLYTIRKNIQVIRKRKRTCII